MGSREQIVLKKVLEEAPGRGKVKRERKLEDRAQAPPPQEIIGFVVVRMRVNVW